MDSATSAREARSSRRTDFLKKVTWILVCLGVASLTAPAGAMPPESQETLGSETLRRNAVGALLPVPLRTPSERGKMRQLHDEMLAVTGASYRQMTVESDPLREFRRTGDRGTIPNPTRGGRENNNNDRLTNLILGWLLYDDPIARRSALNVAEWLAESLERQDHGHLQRHPSLALAALITPDPELSDTLLDAFLKSYQTLQHSKFWWEENWMIGMTGVRPFFRAVGAAHRYTWILNRLVAEGYLTDDQLDRMDFRFDDTESFLNRVDDHFSEMLHFRKVPGDDEPRGWQTDPGGWYPGLPVTFWPYLDSREPAGRNSVWFHYGQIIPFEMLSIKIYHPERFTPLFADRTAEIVEWALEIGSDLLGEEATGRTLRSRSNWFFPTNPVLSEPFRFRSIAEKKEDGERTYCVLPAIYFVRDRLSTRIRAATMHVETSGFTTFPGEVSFAAMLTLWQASLDMERRERKGRD